MIISFNSFLKKRKKKRKKKTNLNDNINNNKEQQKGTAYIHVHMSLSTRVCPFTSKFKLSFSSSNWNLTSLSLSLSLSLFVCFEKMANSHQQSLLRSTPSSSISSKLLLLLTVLPLTLAALAFVLQWRGGITDPTTRWAPPGSQHLFPGMDPSPLSPTAHQHQSSSSDCASLRQGSTPSFPYYHGWKFDDLSNLKPKVRFLCEILWFWGWFVIGFALFIDLFILWIGFWWCFSIVLGNFECCFNLRLKSLIFWFWVLLFMDKSLVVV